MGSDAHVRGLIPWILSPPSQLSPVRGWFDSARHVQSGCTLSKTKATRFREIDVTTLDSA
jgi:hypothetical protein